MTRTIDDIQRDIDKLTLELARAKNVAAETRVAKLREKHGVLVVCSSCRGGGEVEDGYWEPGDPLSECDSCGGTGCRWAWRFERLQEIGDEDFEAVNEVYAEP